MEIIDTHLHIWDLDKFSLPWLDDEGEILNRTYLLEDYKKSIISEGVTRGLDCNSALKDSGIFYMGPIKETWSISKIGYICTKLSRGFLPEDTALVCSNKGKVLIRDENAVGKMVSEDNAGN